MHLFLWALAPVLGVPTAAESSEVVNVARGQPCEVSVFSIQTSCDALVDGNLSTPLPEAKVVDDKGNISNAVTNMLYRIQLRSPTFVLQIVIWFVPSVQGVDADLKALEVHWTGKNPKDQHQVLSSAPAYLQLVPDRNIVRLAVRFHAEAETVIVGFTKPQIGTCPQLTEVAVMARTKEEETTSELDVPLEEAPRGLLQVPRSVEERETTTAEDASWAPATPKRTSISRNKNSTGHQQPDGSRVINIKVSWVPGHATDVAKQSLMNSRGVHVGKESNLDDEKHETSVNVMPRMPHLTNVPSLPSSADHLPSAVEAPPPSSLPQIVITDQASKPLPPTAVTTVKDAAQPQQKYDGAWTAVKLQHQGSVSSASMRRNNPPPTTPPHSNKAKIGETESLMTPPEVNTALKFLARRESQDSAFPTASEGPHVFSIGIIAFAMVLAVMVMPAVRFCTSKVEEPSDYENIAIAPRPNAESTHGSHSAAPTSPRAFEPCAEPSESEPDAEPLGSACSPEPGDAQPLQKLPLHLPGLPLVTAVPSKVAPKPKPEEARSVALLFASPLVYRHPTQGPTPLPQLQFAREWHALTRACRSESGSLLPAVVPFLATAETLQGAVAGTLSLRAEVLHLGMHSKDNCLVLDNGSCTAHFLECRALRGLLECTGTDPPRLVFLGACNSSKIGFEFIHAGVPHVICTTRDVGDNAASLFARAFYRHLFRGHTVTSAFRAARGAVGASPDVAPAEADSYVLLPEEEDHSAVLFPAVARKSSQMLRDSPDSEEEAGPSGSSDGKEGDAGSSDSEEESPLLIQKPRAEIMKSVPQIRRVPSRISHDQREQLAFEQHLQELAAPPEDFMGRTLDVWAVLQHLSRRRVTIVCGESETCHGIGKTAILEGVARSILLQSQVRCVRVDLRSLTDARIAESPAAWAFRAVQALKQQGNSSGNRSRGNRPPRCRGPSNTCLFNNDAGTIPEVLELIEVLRSLGEGVDRLVLLLDESDHLIQQRHFQEALTILLQGCGKLHVLLTTQQPMVGDLGRFKVVHHTVGPLEPKAAARLFLQRCRRPLRWDEIAAPSNVRSGNVIMMKENEGEVLVCVARHPAVSSLTGNPKLIVEQGSRVGPSLRTLADLVPEMVPAHEAQVSLDENSSRDGEGRIT